MSFGRVLGASGRKLTSSVYVYSVRRFIMPIATDEIAQRAAQADQLILQLKNEIANLHTALLSSYKKEEESKLSKENDSLRLEIEEWKKKLIGLEISHGIRQVAMPQKRAILQSDSSPPSTPLPEDGPKIETTPQAKAGKEISMKEKKNKDEKTEKAKPKQAPTTEVVDVTRLDLRIGRILNVSKHPDADGLYVEQIDVGEEKPRTIISGLVKHIKQEELQDRLVMVLCNLKPAKMRGIASEGMVMCASIGENVEVLTPPEGAVPGDRVTCEGFEGTPDAQLNPKKKIFEQLAPDLKTNNQFLACYKGANLVVKGKGTIKSATLANVPVK